MRTLSEFEKARHRKLAAEFVERYEKHGGHISAVWLSGELSVSQMDEIRPFVREAFEEKGYNYEFNTEFEEEPYEGDE